MTEYSGIETYPVGLLSDIKHKQVRYGLKRLWKNIKQHKWRSVRNYFNGYLAEWSFPPEGMTHYRCGKGWTRAAARRSLGRHLVASNLSPREVA